MKDILHNNKILKDINILKGINFLSSLNDTELSDILKFVTKKTFFKNEVILSEEDTTNYMYIIFSGRVKVVQKGIDGREHIVAFHKKGDFFGEMALLDGKTSPATVIAIEDSEIGLIKKDVFNNLFLKNEKILREIISMLCQRLRQEWIMHKVITISNADQRVRMVLKKLSEQNGVKDVRGTIITLKVTHKDIADYAVTSRETVTRILNRLIAAGEIEILKDKYILLKKAFFEKIP